MAHPGKPPYVDPAGDARHGQLPVRPPFFFTGVTARVFPLRANMALLANFVDAYLNMDIPPEIVQFRPALPYVYLMVLDYGSMSSASMDAQNVGWVAQHEVAFTVPLERWRRVDGQDRFEDWACVSPFIFVDDETSLTTGREVYGWPKVAGRVEAITPMWARRPLAGTRVFTFSTAVFPRAYAGQVEAPRVLLEIDADAAPTYSEFPPDPGNRWAPWNVLGQAARSSWSLMGQAADLLLGLRARGFRNERGLDAWRAMGGKAAGYLLGMGPALLPASLGGLVAKAGGVPAADGGMPQLAFDNVTVKQFRDAEEPQRACYKALVRSTMGVQRINRGGMLGDANLLRGDSSGGYRIRVHRYMSLPVIQSLGIEVASTDRHEDGTEIATIAPVLPFWNDVDLFYGVGHVICARTYARGVAGLDVWVDEQDGAAAAPAVNEAHPAADGEARVAAGAAPAAATAPMSDAPSAVESGPGSAPDAGRSAGANARASGAYNNALGGATQPVAGPFRFPDVTQQVFPLLCDRARLDAFVERYLNEPLRDAGLHFEAMGSYAYLMVNVVGDQIGTMWSAANDIGWWAEREVSFCVPVKWFRVDASGERELLSVALVAPFVYANNGRAVATDREVNGRPSWQATIESPKDAWLESSGPVKPRRMLRVATEVFPAMMYGVPAEERTLLEIDGGDVLHYTDEVGWRMVGERWGHTLVADLVRKHRLAGEQADEIAAAKAMALEILAHDAPINWLVLKQYRDAADVERVCYQALVQVRRTIERVYDIREIEDRVHVRLHRFPGHPIAEALGLEIKNETSAGGHVIQNLQPLRPFWMRVSVCEDLGRVVAVRRPDGSWHSAHPWLGRDNVSVGLMAYGHSAGPVDAAGRSMADVPYFAAAGRTRVATRWPAGPQRLRDQQASLLQPVLIASVAAAAKALAATAGSERPTLLARLPSEGRALFDALAGAASPADAASGVDLGALHRLDYALSAAGPDGPVDDPRLTHAQARAALGRLDEVQLVLEAILGAEWEHWGNPRWYRGLPPKPEPCVPTQSLQGGLNALLACAPGLPPGAFLTQTDDGWCHLASVERDLRSAMPPGAPAGTG